MTSTVPAPPTNLRTGPLTDERITQALAAFCTRTDAGALPPEVRLAASRLVLDFVGVALRGSQELSSRTVLEAVSHLTTAQAAGATVIGHELRFPAEYAALVNGASVHGLELDDIHPAAAIHPGSAVIAAALAIGEATGATGAEVLAAVVVGYEVSCRLSRGARPSAHGGHGFHSTATCGIFGAIAAVGKILRLSEDELVNAFGIGGSQTAGSIEFLADGAWTKRMHPGWAAHSAIVAARLAEAGFTGPKRIFEGKSGFLSSYSDNPDPDATTAGLGAGYQILDVAIKPHAACRYSQGAIDAILELRTGLELAAIRRVTIRLFKAAFAIVVEPEDIKRRPRSVVDAQFSVFFAAAATLARGQVTLDEYQPAVMDSPEIAALIDKVDVVWDPELDASFPQEWPAIVEIELDDGSVLRRRVDTLRGDRANPLSRDDLLDKFRTLTGVGGDDEVQGELIARLEDLENTPAEQIGELLRQTSARSSVAP